MDIYLRMMFDIGGGSFMRSAFVAGAPTVSWSYARCFRRALNLSALGLRPPTPIRTLHLLPPLLHSPIHDACACVCVSRPPSALINTYTHFSIPCNRTSVPPQSHRAWVHFIASRCITYCLPFSFPRHYSRLVRHPTALATLSCCSVHSRYIM